MKRRIEDIEFHHRDVEDLKANPAWERIEAELRDRLEACMELLLELPDPAAIEAKLIKDILERPKGLLNKLDEERTDAIKSG